MMKSLIIIKGKEKTVKMDNPHAQSNEIFLMCYSVRALEINQSI